MFISESLSSAVIMNEVQQSSENHVFSMQVFSSTKYQYSNILDLLWKDLNVRENFATK